MFASASAFAYAFEFHGSPAALFLANRFVQRALPARSNLRTSASPVPVSPGIAPRKRPATITLPSLSMLAVSARSYASESASSSSHSLTVSPASFDPLDPLAPLLPLLPPLLPPPLLLLEPPPPLPDSSSLVQAPAPVAPSRTTAKGHRSSRRQMLIAKALLRSGSTALPQNLSPYRRRAFTSSECGVGRRTRSAIASSRDGRRQQAGRE